MPRVVRAKLAGFAKSKVERFLYSPSGARFPKPVRPVHSLGIFHSSVNSDSFSSSFADRFGEDAIALRFQGGLAVDRIVDILGTGPVDLKTKGPNYWNEDFKSGREWDPRSFYTSIRSMGNSKSDIKVPWELSRCQHFIPLAQSYVLTRDERYAEAYFAQIQSWICGNPPKFGVNWRCSMDIALRAVNWLAAWDIFKNSPSMTDFFKKNFSPILWEHGRHIRDHLEWGAEVSTNHYLADLLGLFALGLALDEREWIEFAQSELAVELFHQTYEDGFGYEGSTAYQRLDLEIYFTYALLCSRNAARVRSLGAVFVERLAAMFEVVTNLSAADGTIPFIGDNDSGRVLSFLKREDNDMRYLPGIGSLLLEEPALKINEWASASDAAWLFGMEGMDRLLALKGRSVHQIKSKLNAKSGMLTICGANDLLVFCAAPNGTGGVGNHTHNDKLSFCLWVNGEWFFVDPGSGVYTSNPALRNSLRSTRAHNTVVVDSQEQNRIEPASLFTLHDDVSMLVDERTLEAVVEAAHTGYRRIGITHRRRIERVSPLKWQITDRLEGDGDRTFEWNFHFAPGLHVIAEGSAVRINGKNGFVNLIPSLTTLHAEIVPDVFSPRYGVTVESSAARYLVAVRAPFEVKFEIVYNPIISGK